tara:strand:- start:9514 stop:9810 length:297 start_codon:yes stop_codon:yes gene_type:complete
MVTTRSGFDSEARPAWSGRSGEVKQSYEEIYDQYANILNQYELDHVYYWVTRPNPLLKFNKDGSINKKCSVYRNRLNPDAKVWDNTSFYIIHKLRDFY